MTWLLDNKPLRKILLTRLRYLGDVVMTTPLLGVLKKGDPELQLGYLAEQNHGRILMGHPLVDRLHLLESRRTGADAKARPAGAQNVDSSSAWGTLMDLRRVRYDLAVDLFFNPRSAWLLRLAGIPARIGGTRGSRRHLFTHNVFPAKDDQQFSSVFAVAGGGMAEHLGRLAPLVHQESGLPFLQWFAEQYRAKRLTPTLSRDNFASGAKGERTGNEPIVLAPGATWPVKEWPLENWRSLIKGLQEKTTRQLLVLQPPGPGHRWLSLADDIQPGRGEVLPVLDLPEALGRICSSALLVSVDGGIMHAAVGLATPTVALFGPTDPGLWFPYSGAGPFRVLATGAACSPCHLHHCDEFICLPELSADLVLDNCLELLADVDRGGH